MNDRLLDLQWFGGRQRRIDVVPSADGRTPVTVDAMFRDAHSVKGMSASMASSVASSASALLSYLA